MAAGGSPEIAGDRIDAEPERSLFAFTGSWPGA